MSTDGRRDTDRVSEPFRGISRYPQDQEAAVYFCVLEALQNVAKHYEMRLASCVRDFTSSFRNTLPKWYSTVLGLMKS